MDPGDQNNAARILTSDDYTREAFLQRVREDFGTDLSDPRAAAGLRDQLLELLQDGDIQRRINAAVRLELMGYVLAAFREEKVLAVLEETFRSTATDLSSADFSQLGPGGLLNEKVVLLMCLSAGIARLNVSMAKDLFLEISTQFSGTRIPKYIENSLRSRGYEFFPSEDG